MGQNRSIPIFSLAANAVVQSVNSIVPFFQIFWLPSLAGTLAVISSKLIWIANAQSSLSLPPRWLDAIAYAPFATIITILALRYFTNGQTHSWRRSPWIDLGDGFLIVVMIHVIWGLVFQYSDVSLYEFLTFLHSFTSQPSAFSQFLTDYFWAPHFLNLALRLASAIANALIVLVFVGAVWTFATEKRLDLNGYWTTIRHHWFKLLIYLIAVEIVIAQMTMIYHTYVLWPVWTPWQLGTTSPFWRDHVMPEVLLYTILIPLTFFTNLFWFAAIAEFFRNVSSKDSINTTSQIMSR